MSRSCLVVALLFCLTQISRGQEDSTAHAGSTSQPAASTDSAPVDNKQDRSAKAPPETPAEGSDTPQDSSSAAPVTPPLPNSAAEAGALVNPAPEVVANPAEQDSGPGVLSRSFSISPLETGNVRFQPFLTLSGIYDSGLVSTVSNSTQLDSVGSGGLDAGFGITGRRISKRDVVELHLHGDVYRYTPDSAFDGGNYILTLAYRHYFSHRLYAALTESASYYTNNYTQISSLTNLSVAGAQTSLSPNLNLLNSPTLNLSTGGDVVFQKTARLSFDFGASGFLYRYEDTSLFESVGSQARFDATYRLTRRLTGGAYYAYTDYAYNRAYGGSIIDTAGFLASYTINRGFELRVRLGGSYLQTKGIQSFTLDPVIAQILGTSTGTEVVRSANLIPDISVQLSKNFRHGSASAEYVQSVSPGNGLIQTSRHTGESAHVNYTGFRLWTLSLSGGRDVLDTVGVVGGNYGSTIAQFGVIRQLTRGFQGNSSIQFRHYDLSANGFLQNTYRVQIGFAWTPSERPLNIW